MAFVWLVVVSLFVTELSWSQERRFVPSSGDWRESCRQELAGRLLLIHDLAKRADGTLSSAGADLEQFREALTAAEAKLASARRAYESSEYDSQLARDVQNLRHKRQTLLQVISQSQSLQEKARGEKRQSAEDLKVLEGQLREVFRVDRIDKAQKAGGYPYRLEYRYPCPKYRFLCKLPLDQAKKLKQVTGEQTPEACVRYAQLSGAD